MFLGESRAGKSHAARDLLDAEGLPVALVNDHTKDPLRPGYTRITWEQVLSVSHANVLVEDLINCTSHEVEILKQVVNYNAHHHTLPTVVLIAHASTGTGAYSVLKFMTHFCFMNKRSSMDSIASVLQHFHFPPGDRKTKLDAFLGDLGRVERGYWVLDVNGGKFERQPGSLTQRTVATAAAAAAGHQVLLPPGEKKKLELCDYRKTAETYLNLFCPGESSKALAIFDFVMPRVPLHSLNPTDLNFTLRDRKTGNVVSVSLLDYLSTVTSQAKPTRSVLDLHGYLARYVAIPQLFLTNRNPSFHT